MLKRRQFLTEQAWDDGVTYAPISNYVKHLESQLTAASIEIERLREALIGIATDGCCNGTDDFCHETETPIEEYCPPCKAQQALSTPHDPSPILRMAAAALDYLSLLDGYGGCGIAELEDAAEALSQQDRDILAQIAKGE